MPDLSKNPNSATSIFINIMPLLKGLQNTSIIEDEKVNIAKQIIMGELRAAWQKSNNISKSYIIRVKDTLEVHTTIDQVIEDIETRIHNGKNL